MERFGVSRVTTNRALRMLAAEDLIVRKIGAGTFVQSKFENSDVPMAKTNVDTDHLSTQASTKLIGFVIPQLWGDYALSLVMNTERVLQQKGMTLAVSCSYGQQRLEQERIEQLLQLNVKGLIVFPTDGDYYNDAILRLYIERLPMVVVDKRMPGVPLPHVMSDNIKGAKDLTNYLLELGHEQISFMTIPVEGTSTLFDRYKGFTEAINESGLQLNPDYYVDLLDYQESGEGYDEKQLSFIEEFLRAHSQITAVFATRYEIAEHVYKVAENMGLRVPEDLTIVCFDGASSMPMHWQFTRVVQDGKAVATEALRILFDIIDGKESSADNVTIPTKFCMGHTSGPRK
jgi:DNA-binding LacI/PurR family transcriptional regulator